MDTIAGEPSGEVPATSKTSILDSLYKLLEDTPMTTSPAKEEQEDLPVVNTDRPWS